MNCCNDMTGACQQGHGCPVRATRHYTCAELGVCNCDGPDCLQQGDDNPATPIDHIAYWAAVLACSALTVGVLAGVAGYFVAG